MTETAADSSPATEVDHVTPFRDAIQQLAEIPDPAERALAAGTVLAVMPDLHSEVRTVRQEAVIEMRETMGVAEVAEALGVAVPRVSQITKGVSRTAKHAG